MNLSLADLGRLRCPRCREALVWSGTEASGGPGEGRLACARGASWAVRQGLPRLYEEHEIQGPDRFMRRIYDALPGLHDPAVRYTLPLFQYGRRDSDRLGCTEESLRTGLVARLRLDELEDPGDRPVRILEVGVGSGANLGRLRAGLTHLPRVEIWALDLSAGMLRQCRRRLERAGDRETRLLMADAHALPFADASFDRCFHVGGIGAFRDPGLALRELARVSVAGSPVVVVDEQLDPEGHHRLHHRLLFKAVTFYDDDPHSPVEHVPPGATEVRSEQLSRFFYCLSFRSPGSGTPASR